MAETPRLGYSINQAVGPGIPNLPLPLSQSHSGKIYKGKERKDLPGLSPCCLSNCHTPRDQWESAFPYQLLLHGVPENPPRTGELGSNVLVIQLTLDGLITTDCYHAE